MGAISGAIFAAVLYALAPASGIGFFAAGFLAGVAAHNVETMVEYTLTGTYSWTPWRMLVAGYFGGALAAMFYFAGRFLRTFRTLTTDRVVNDIQLLGGGPGKLKTTTDADVLDLIADAKNKGWPWTRKGGDHRRVWGSGCTALGMVKP